ncbi:hypothetical protein K8R43_02065 [archaeon]|nr:hypothetical protein [archaeon]
MAIDDTVGWYKKQREEGFTKSELIQMLKELGYSDSQLHEIVEKASETVVQEQPKKESLSYAEVPLRSRSTSVSDIVQNEISALWKIIIFGLILVLLIIGAAILVVYNLNSSGENGLSINKADNMPPKLTAGLGSNWDFYSGSLGFSCDDSGIDYISGCNTSSFRFMVTESECSQSYSDYSRLTVLDLNQGQLVCVTVKDNEGTPGFSSPVQLGEKYKDLVKPLSASVNNIELISQDAIIEFTDTDGGGSGIKECYYQVSSFGQEWIVTMPWAKRNCNSIANVVVGNNGCKHNGIDTCMIEFYAIDGHGNKGDVQSIKLSLDLTSPKAVISSITPSDLTDGIYLLEGIVTIKGTASDTNFKEYLLEYYTSQFNEILTISTTPANSETLFLWDTTFVSNGQHKLKLTVTDLAGNTKVSELIVFVQND